jgi:hypothetical protein
MYPAMRRAGYPENFSAGLVTAVGAIDIIICMNRNSGGFRRTKLIFAPAIVSVGTVH